MHGIFFFCKIKGIGISFMYSIIDLLESIYLIIPLGAGS